jgi:hypothetical protein
MTAEVGSKKLSEFDPKTFLSIWTAVARSQLFQKSSRSWFRVTPPMLVFIHRKVRVRLTIVSQSGKEATIDILEGDFFGKGYLTGQPLRLCSATAITDCPVMIGTTFLRMSFFKNRIRKLGFIDHHAGDDLQSHSSVLNIVLHLGGCPGDFVQMRSMRT